MLGFYRFITSVAEAPLKMLLQLRLRRGKEDPVRLNERMGLPGQARPKGSLLWIHAASVGESQSALVLIETLLKRNPDLSALVTTGTRTSAALMTKKLPSRSIHQFYPLDHPLWVERFLDYWHPEAALWMESELWPNMITAIAKHNIPLALVNARLSKRSFDRWAFFPKSATSLLQSFSVILAQTATDSAYFRRLGAGRIIVTDNLKYSAAPLPVSESDLKPLQDKIGNRPNWVFASTHKGEEIMAARLHKKLKSAFPDLLTIIVPRHPDRRDEIAKALSKTELQTIFRGTDKSLPGEKTDLYIADTMGELGLFYTLSPIACVGRSFSDDGGGGHNPIEAAQLNCAVLHGPHVQFQQRIFDDMHAAGAAIQCEDEAALAENLRELLADNLKLKKQQEQSATFAKNKNGVLNHVLEHIEPLLHQPKAKAS